MKTENLSQLLLIESACGITAAALVAPFVSIIDVAIFSNASGKEKLASALVSGLQKFLFHPIQFIKHPSFYLIWGVYSGTYAIANATQVICEFKDISWFYPKFLSTSVANVSLSALKDVYLTRAFGRGQARRVPFTSFGLYTMRDSLTIFASFNLPSILSTNIVTQLGWSVSTADVASQLITPCAVQLVSTPLHLLGMDLYNRSSCAWNERASFIKKEYIVTSAARMGRIFPAFGIGGVANKYLRSKSREWIGYPHKP